MEAHDVHRAWSLYYSDEGFPYFYNHVTKESYWAELPKSLALSTGVEADDSWKTYDAADAPVVKKNNDSYVSSSSSNSTESSESTSDSLSEDSDSNSEDENENKRDFKAYLESTDGLDVVNDIKAHADRIEELKLKSRHARLHARLSRVKKRERRRKRLNKDNNGNQSGIFSIISQYIQYFQGYIYKVPNNPLIELENVAAADTTATTTRNEAEENENETNKNKRNSITPMVQRCVPEVVTTILINNIIPAALPVYTTVTSAIQNTSNLLLKKAMESVATIGCVIWQSIEPTIAKLVENSEQGTGGEKECEEAMSIGDIDTILSTVVEELDFSKLPPAPPNRPPPMRSPVVDNDQTRGNYDEEIIHTIIREVVTNVININSGDNQLCTICI